MKVLKKPTATLIADFVDCPRKAYLKAYWVSPKHSFFYLQSIIMHDLVSEVMYYTLNAQKIDNFVQKIRDLNNKSRQRVKTALREINLEECIHNASATNNQIFDLNLSNSENIEAILEEVFSKEQEQWISGNLTRMVDIVEDLSQKNIKISYIREYGNYKSIYSDRLVGRPDGIVFFKKNNEKKINVAPFEIKKSINPRAIVQNAAYSLLIKDRFNYIKTLFERETGLNPWNITLSNDLWFFEYDKDKLISIFPANRFENIAEKNLKTINNWILGNPPPRFEDFYNSNSKKCHNCIVSEECKKKPDEK